MYAGQIFKHLPPGHPAFSFLSAEVWEILESYQKHGIFRSLGVCNFDLPSLQLLEQAALGMVGIVRDFGICGAVFFNF